MKSLTSTDFHAQAARKSFQVASLRISAQDVANLCKKPLNSHGPIKDLRRLAFKAELLATLALEVMIGLCLFQDPLKVGAPRVDKKIKSLSEKQSMTFNQT